MTGTLHYRNFFNLISDTGIFFFTVAEKERLIEDFFFSFLYRKKYVFFYIFYFESSWSEGDLFIINYCQLHPLNKAAYYFLTLRTFSAQPSSALIMNYIHVQ